MARAIPMKVGDLVARAGEPEALYRVESRLGTVGLRLLPYQRSGSEVIITRLSGAWSDGMSRWIRVLAA